MTKTKRVTVAKNSTRFVAVMFLIQSLLFTPLIQAEQLALPAADLIAPEVEHVPVTGPLATGALHPVKATVTDNVGIESVSLFYRRAGDAQYQRKAMLRETADSHLYTVTLGNNELTAPGIEYYIQATDLAGNSVLYGYAFEPIKLSVTGGAGETADTTAEAVNQGEAGKPKSNYTWLWIALGVLAVGALAASAGGGDDGGGAPSSGPGTDTGNVVISGPVPQ